MVPDDSAGPVDVTESVPLTAEALEKLFWQQFQTTATQTSRSQTPENTCLDGETQTDITGHITYDVTSLGPASLIDPLTIGDTDSAVSTTSSDAVNLWARWAPIRNLEVQLTLFQPEGHYAHHITACPLGFENPAAALLYMLT